MALTRALLRFVVAVVAFTALPVGAFTGLSVDLGGLERDASVMPSAEDCGPAAEDAASVAWTPEAEAAAVLDPSLGVDQKMLERLHTAFVHLPGFVDVHIVLQGAPRFVALFSDEVPPALPFVDAPYPLTAERIAAVPLSTVQPLDAAPTPAPSGLLQDPPLVPETCVGLRPGKGLLQQCTLAWMARGSDGKLYAVSAGHCVSGVGQFVGYGTVRFKRAEGVGRDFTVIEVSASYVPQASPAMCHWGGPTAMAAAGGLGSLVLQYGNGLGFGSTVYTRPRPAELYSFGATSYSMVGPQINGDSGSPARLDSGPALGVHTHGLGVIIIGTGLGYGTRLSHGFGMAEAAMGVGFTLLTAPEA